MADFSSAMFEMTPIFGQPVKGANETAIRNAVKLALYDTILDAQKLFMLIIEPWHHAVKLEQDVKVSGNEGNAWIGTNDKPFLYLDKGTSVQHAVMRRGYNFKTKPGRYRSMGSGQDSRKYAYVNPAKFNYPGIAARDWTTKMAGDLSLNLVTHVRRRMAEIGIILG